MATAPGGAEYTDDYLVYGDEVEIRIEVVTPDRARSILEKNGRNRNIRSAGTKELSEALVSGDWCFNGDAIRIDKLGNLLDGQHRLLACVETDHPITVLVITGLEPEVQDTIDIGRKRTVSDALEMAGYQRTKALAGGLVLLHGWMRWGLLNRGSNRGQLTPRRALALLAEHPDFAEHAKTNGRLTKLSPPSGWVVTSYILHRIDPVDAAAFLDGIASGANLAEGDPRLTLRRRLEKEHEGPSTTVSQAAQNWMILRAWQVFQQRASIKKLLLPPSIGSASEWPDLRGDDLRFSLAKEND